MVFLCVAAALVGKRLFERKNQIRSEKRQSVQHGADRRGGSNRRCQPSGGGASKIRRPSRRTYLVLSGHAIDFSIAAGR
jgi:hypothetical protein